MREPDITAGRGGLSNLALQYYQGAQESIKQAGQNLQNAHNALTDHYKRQREEASHESALKAQQAQTDHYNALTDTENAHRDIKGKQLQENLKLTKANIALTNSQTKLNQTQYNDWIAIKDALKNKNTHTGRK